MPVKQKATADEKIHIAKLCLSGKLSQHEAAKQVGVSKTTVQSWVAKYEFQGELGFNSPDKNLIYPIELKQAAVDEYLIGGDSIRSISAKYGLRSKTQLERWVICNRFIIQYIV